MAVASGTDGAVGVSTGPPLEATFDNAAIGSGDWALCSIVISSGYTEADVTGTDLGGVSGTFVGKVSWNLSAIGQGTRSILVYRFAGPISANATLTVSSGDSIFPANVACLCSVTGAHASTPTGTTNGGSDTDGSVGASITVPGDGLAVSFGYGVDLPAPNLGWSNATERSENTDGLVAGGVATGTSGSPSVSFTPAAVGLIAIISIPVSPAGGGASIIPLVVHHRKQQGIQ